VSSKLQTQHSEAGIILRRHELVINSIALQLTLSLS